MDGKVINRKDLPKIINLSLGRCDTLLKEASMGKIPKVFIDNNIKVVNTKESTQTIEMVA